MIKNQMNKTEIKTDDMLPSILKDYLEETRERLKGLCEGVLRTLEEKLLPSRNKEQTPYILESRTLYLKVKADNLRYLASFCDLERKNHTPSLL